jgi:hypothetical protein
MFGATAENRPIFSGFSLIFSGLCPLKIPVFSCSASQALLNPICNSWLVWRGPVGLCNL